MSGFSPFSKTELFSISGRARVSSGRARDLERFGPEAWVGGYQGFKNREKTLQKVSQVGRFSFFPSQPKRRKKHEKYFNALAEI